ncbi:MAG: TolC family protein [Bacteroidales bacterium]|nr:TolC family protein [Bacteroidales bacterium]
MKKKAFSKTFYQNLTLSLTCIAFICMPEVYGQSADTLLLSIDSARSMAIEYNFQVKNANKDFEISQKKIWETIAIGLPQISASASFQYNIDIMAQLLPDKYFGGPEGELMEIKFGTEYNVNGAVKVSQLLFDGGYIVGLQAAKIYSELALNNIEKTETTVKNMVSRTYFAARMFRENRDITIENLNNIKKTLLETEQQYKAGFADEIKLDQLRLTEANLSNALLNLDRQVLLTEQLLKFQIGIDLAQPIILTNSLENLMDGLLLENLLVKEFVADNHIDMRLIKTQEELKILSLRREKASLIPSMSAFFSHQQSALRNEFNFGEQWKPWYPTTMVGVSLNIPIFSSGMRMAKVSQAKLEVEKVNNLRLQTEQSLQLDVINIKAELQTAYEKYEVEKGNMELAKKILRHTEAKFNSGMASSMELTQANDQLLKAQSNYFSAIFNVLDAYKKLETALGVSNK